MPQWFSEPSQRIHFGVICIYAKFLVSRHNREFHFLLIRFLNSLSEGKEKTGPGYSAKMGRLEFLHVDVKYWFSITLSVQES